MGTFVLNLSNFQWVWALGSVFVAKFRKQPLQFQNSIGMLTSYIKALLTLGVFISTQHIPSENSMSKRANIDARGPELLLATNTLEHGLFEIFDR